MFTIGRCTLQTSRGTMEVEMRKATANDYTEVLGLDPDHQIYGGNDYMPSQYHKFIRDPDKIINVCVYQGHIIALAMVYYVDNGETVVGMAARNHPDVRGQGVWRALKYARRVGAHIDLLEGVKCVVGVTDIDRWHMVNKHTTFEAWTEPHITLKRVIRMFGFDSNQIKAHQLPQQTTGSVTTRILAPEESLRWLRNPHIQWQLFPNKRIACGIGPVVYRLLDVHFYKIIKECDAITASLDCHGACQSLAFGGGFEVHNGYQYGLHYYGNDHCDIPNVIQHVLIHLQVAVMNQSKQPLQLRLYLPAHMREEEITRAFTNIPGLKCVPLAIVPLVVFDRNRRDTISAKL